MYRNSTAERVPLASRQISALTLPACLQPLTTLRILDVHGIEEAPAM